MLIRLGKADNELVHQIWNLICGLSANARKQLNELSQETMEIQKSVTKS